MRLGKKAAAHLAGFGHGHEGVLHKLSIAKFQSHLGPANRSLCDGLTLAVDGDEAVACLNSSWELPVYGVVLEKVGKSCVICEVVDRNDIDIWIGKGCTEEVTANTSKTINSNINNE